jgi:two-component system sensor histidine kinase KdpD
VAAEDAPFVALRTRRGVVGVLGLGFESRLPLATERRRLLYAMADQVAVAIERTLLMMDIEQTRLRDETEHLRAALLSSVSHDLKTPLVSIIGSATALADDAVKLPEESRRSLIQAVLEEAQRLHRFVQNLLDMTRLSYGKLTITRRWCELGEIVSRARRQTEKVLAKHRLDVRLPNDLPEILVDPVLIEHVLVNLLDNAAKYAPPGSRVEVAASSGAGRIALTVTDEGPGIAEAEREAVFDQFYRARAEDRQTAGTGLGLSICRGLVDAHGGTIVITAGPGGKGACVTVTLPLEAVGQGAPGHEDPATEELEP